MKGLIAAAAAALALTGCIAVPAPYGGDPYYDAYYYGPPAVGVGIYAAPHRHHHYHHRHHRHRHWR